MPRLFTGIEIPDHVGRSLAMLRGGVPGARWIDAGNYHLTLRFVGDVDGRTASELADALGRVDRPGFEVELDGVAAFGSSKPHAIVAKVAPSRTLTEMQAEQERIAQRLGLPADPRKFTPHVTLARLRGTSPRQVADYLAMRGGFRAGPFRVERFVLFSARDSVGGGPYLVEEAYQLRRAAA